MRPATVTLLASTLLVGCSTAEAPGDIFDMGPDASPPEDEVLEDVGCLVTIAYPSKADAPETDHLVYDQQKRLVRSRRTYSDGVVAERRYTWSPDGREVVREWFDGSKRSQLDGDGKVIESTSFDLDGAPTWRDELTYEGDLLVERKIFRVRDDVHYSTTTYEYDADRVTRQSYQNHVDEDDESTVRYTYTVQSDGLKMVKAFDDDGDGVVEYKTAVVIAASGLVDRGVDESGQLVDYEYQGEMCESIAAGWAAADPFFVDL